MNFKLPKSLNFENKKGLDFHPNIVDNKEDMMEDQRHGWDWKLINE